MIIDKAALRKMEKVPHTLRDIVQGRIRNANIEGHFAPGDRLVERRLCEQLGVSHMSAIRDAILSKDPKSAQRAVDAHIDEAFQIAKRLLSEEEKAREKGA